MARLIVVSGDDVIKYLRAVEGKREFTFHNNNPKPVGHLHFIRKPMRMNLRKVHPALRFPAFWQTFKLFS